MASKPGIAAKVATATFALLAGTVVAAAPSSAAPIVNDSEWVRGQTSFNTRFVCIYTCQSYTMVMNNVNFQGPIGNIGAVPKVGDRFYIHVYTAVVSPFTLNDSYRMQLLLPEGLKVDIRSDTDVQCAITDLSWNLSRLIGPSECQDPVKVGVYDQFPAVALSEGEAASFFVPVVADRTFNGDATIGLVSDPITNPYTSLPDPLYATNSKLVVNAAAENTGGGQTGPGTGGPVAPVPGPSGGTGGTSGPGTAPPTVVRFAVPAALRGAKGIRTTTPRICTVTGKGKRAKVLKVRAGKCKLVGSKRGKKIRVTLRLR